MDAGDADCASVLCTDAGEEGEQGGEEDGTAPAEVVVERGGKPAADDGAAELWASTESHEYTRTREKRRDEGSLVV